MVMNEEQFKKHIKELARIEFENNIKNNLDSSIIFKYIQGLEQENQQLKSVLNEVREECETNIRMFDSGKSYSIAVKDASKDILKILDKVGDK